MKDNEKRDSVDGSGSSDCKLEMALRIIATWAACDSSAPYSRQKAMQEIHDKAMEALNTKAT